MRLEKINASYITVSFPALRRSEWLHLLKELDVALLALPKNIAPPERLGCNFHPEFDPTCNLCWVNFRLHNAYRLYRFWQEGGELYFRIPIGGLILILNRHRENLPKVVVEFLRESLIRHYPRLNVFNFDPMSFPVALYPYQISAVTQAIKYRRCIISSPPGSGKTEIGSALIHAMAKNMVVGWFTHTRTLLRQSHTRLERNLGEKVGLISGEDDFAPQRVTVAMIQTITLRGKERNDPQIIGWLRSLDAVVLDECHHAPASTFYWSLMSCTNAWIRFGLTATPMREESEEEKYIWAAFSPLIVEIKPSELVMAGRLVPIYLVFYDISTNGIYYSSQYGSWQEEYSNVIVRNKLRNYIIAAEAIVYRPSVILVWSIEHMRLIADAIADLSKRFEIPIRYEIMYGDTPSKRRAEIIQLFETGNLDILIISDVGKEGLNIINLRSLIVAAGQKSKVAAIQRVGRGLRPKKWGYVRVVDFYDASDITRRHSFRRSRIYQRELPVIRYERKRAEDGLRELVELLKEEKEKGSLVTVGST